MEFSSRIIAVATASLVAVSSSVAAAARLAVDLTGNWAFEVVTENGTGMPAVTMTQKGDSLTGTYTSGRLGTLPLNGTIVDADHVKGDVDFGGPGGAAFSGTRKK